MVKQTTTDKMRYKKRIDSNQKEIVKSLEWLKKQGLDIEWMDSHKFGEGFPDLIVRYKNTGFLFEIKDNFKSKLTPAEVEFCRKFSSAFKMYSTIDWRNTWCWIGIENKYYKQYEGLKK
jgi:hypothetical protein